MTRIIRKQTAIYYPHNKGQQKQVEVDFTLTNQIRKADHVPFDKGSDIPELNISVKSARFTLAAILYGDTLEAKVTDYFNRVQSTTWAYATEDGYIYLMNKQEFAEFLLLSCSLQKASSKNGGTKVVRMGTETRAVIQWLEAHVQSLFQKIL